MVNLESVGGDSMIVIAGGLFGAGYAIYRLVQYQKANKAVKEKFTESQIIDHVNYGMKSGMFNAIMAGLSFSLVLASFDSPSIQALYLMIGGLFIGNVFDAYRIKRVFFTKTSFYTQQVSVRYKSINKITPKKRGKSSTLETNQKEVFVFPKTVIDKINEYSNKK